MADMTLAELTPAELRRRLSGPGLFLQLPPYVVQIRSRIARVADAVHRLYSAYALADVSQVPDFRVELRSPFLRRLIGRPQVRYLLDGFEPFKPLPLEQAHALLEWGLNWAVGNEDQTHLTLHAGVVERQGRALILSGDTGAGKSTLTAALAFSGFRLLSDEMCLLSPVDGRVQPVPRPISLKNRSIEVIRGRFPQVQFSDIAHDTHKGSIAHARPPQAALDQAAERPLPALIVFPQYQSGAGLQVSPVPRGEALLRCQREAFNFHVLGERAFDTLLATVQRCQCLALRYDDLDAAINFLRQRLDHEAAIGADPATGASPGQAARSRPLQEQAP